MCRFVILVLVPVIIFSLGQSLWAQTELLSKVKNLRQQKKYQDGLDLLDKKITQTEKNLNQTPVASDLDLLHFEKALIFLDQKKFPESLGEFSQSSLAKSALSDYAAYYRGVVSGQLQQWDQALANFHQVNLKESSLQLKIETQFQIAEIYLKQKKYAQAAPFLRPLERQARGTEKYAEVLFNLALLEKGLQKTAKKCLLLEKLYSRYPSSVLIKDWGFDLSTALFDGSPTKCIAKDEEFRQRLKNWLWSGEEKRALQEINDFRKKVGAENPYVADQMQALYELQAGEPLNAYNILKPYAEKFQNNMSYLLLFASTAARASEIQTAVGSYYQVYKIAPKSTKGRSALYQAAFLSYQFQDYDGAQRRFQEFISLNSSSKLAQEAKWHLAWLKYLKGDYAGAYGAMKTLSVTKAGRTQKVGHDRLQYWMSVSLLKQGQVQQARAQLQKLSKDPLLGYYSVAAQMRLKKIETKDPQKGNLTEVRRPSPRYSVTDVMMPSIDDYSDVSQEADESTETEVTQNLEDTKSEAEDVAVDDTNDEGDKAQEPETAAASTLELKSPNLLKKFEKARDLILLGLNDWAKWDLYDIEKSTRNRDHLKALMSEYSTVDYFHRSSYISQTYFTTQRAQGLEPMRNLWEFAYPEAYIDFVKKSSQETNVPFEYIYGIMKAESSFRKDAISPVGALGLMQVMPLTGRRVADLSGLKNFESSQLLEPDVAIRIGSRYLGRLLKKFDQIFPLVAASYNAGPHRVRAWVNNFGYLETDEFIEHIPFLETRNYVKKVMANANVYNHLYGKSRDVFPYLAESLPFHTIERAPTRETWEDL